MLDEYEALGMGWLWATNEHGNLVYSSDRLLDALGVDAASALGQPLGDLVETDPDKLDEKSSRPLTFLLGSRLKVTDLTVRPKAGSGKRHGQPLWLSLSGRPKFDNAGNFQGYRGGFRDITEQYQRELDEMHQAMSDALTGLANRHRHNAQLDGYLSAFSAAKRSCALILLDLDRFKQVNDTMGHPAGDELLRQVADRLRRIVGDNGEIGRLGGDEFAIILPDMDDRGRLGELADRIIQIVSQPYPIDAERAVIGTSVGIAVAPHDGLEREHLVKSADLALYAAKKGGRGQFRFFSADLKDEKVERQLLLDDLRKALGSDALQLRYQPVVRADDNAVVGFEALMRWDHPERGDVSPEIFVPIAEESGLIIQIGEWALRRACMEALNWPESVRVAVNVSAVQFAHPGFVAMVTSALEESGLAAERLELELTEGIFLVDGEAAEHTFKTLKVLGVRLVLDDFGTGFSSLSYLRTAPFDKIKVDKSFVETCTLKKQNSPTIIAAIVGLADAIGMETTVEGVEAFDQLELVRAKGARFIQGWLYSKPLTPEEIAEQVGPEQFKIAPSGPARHRPERRTVIRRIGVIHEDHRYDAVMRSISKTGAMIEGLMGVPAGTDVVLDLGSGQLAYSTVVRSEETRFVVQFETPLVSDGAGGLCTRHRVSPYALAAAGMPLAALPPGLYPLALACDMPANPPRFMQVAARKPVAEPDGYSVAR
ncbi:EAL domain-containing protein [Novosphingobium album (ex Hu et al. 2023)]|uniref:EAL domain-containing protein n=1 Tax=Novosphingobium album (ex Hu et al. 2023) TaxID=2930093 RepID=A0ABT0B3C9_9SPHN|nr:EAL domain-containing protein [Novosphingobium album (ex Hu et al. 2023)]MCJ2179537.1 EAL domain-containing protein [Novosphingobium album (ex Hu et al. 2023)]